MSDPDRLWSTTLSVRSTDPAMLAFLGRALLPESAREVPRARAWLERSDDGRLELRIFAADTGAMRAALNTYLGWIHLAVATVDAAHRPGPSAPGGTA